MNKMHLLYLILAALFLVLQFVCIFKRDENGARYASIMVMLLLLHAKVEREG